MKITEKGLNGQFAYSYSMALMGYLFMLAQRQISNQKKETYAGMGSAPGMVLFKGEHQYSKLGEQ